MAPNFYAYCENDPINNTDKTGHIVDTIFDIVSIAWSTVDLICSPSWKNAGYLAWDIAATVVPFLPGSYVSKAGKAVKLFARSADDLTDGAKVFTSTYRKLRKLFSGAKNIEVHHIIEKRFYKLFSGIHKDDFLSIALDKEFHKTITKKWRKVVRYSKRYELMEMDELLEAVEQVYEGMDTLKIIAVKWVKENWKL